LTYVILGRLTNKCIEPRNVLLDLYKNRIIKHLNNQQSLILILQQAGGLVNWKFGGKPAAQKIPLGV